MNKEIEEFTTESFIKKAINKFGNVYDYSKSNYINAKTKMEIICKKHGSFFQTRIDHLRSKNGCSKCGNNVQSMALLSNGEEFIKKAKEKYGDLYDYSSVKYINSKLKVEIKCQHHGIFIQSPKAHLRAIVGCEKCAHISKYKKTEKDTIEFINKALGIHGNFYDYSNVIYKHSGLKVKITCHLHGMFEQKCEHHLQGSGCPKCAINKRKLVVTKSKGQFVEEAEKIHKNKYLYEEVKYINSKEKIIIICKSHGNFKQVPSEHLKGRGCPKCGKESHWSRSGYIKKADGKECTFYTIRCFNNEEEFYKIGITMNGVNGRYKGVLMMPYNYEILSEVHGEAGFIWDLEVSEKRKLKEFHYTPKIEFAGSKTERFTDYKLQ